MLGERTSSPSITHWLMPSAPSRPMLIPLIVACGLFMENLDSTVLSTALPAIAYGDTVKVSCDGCAGDLTARVSFIARQSEFTPPVIYSLEERSKLVFLIEALPEKPGELRVGQPVDVTLLSRKTAAPKPAPQAAK